MEIITTIQMLFKLLSKIIRLELLACSLTSSVSFRITKFQVTFLQGLFQQL